MHKATTSDETRADFMRHLESTPDVGMLLRDIERHFPAPLVKPVSDKIKGLLELFHLCGEFYALRKEIDRGGDRIASRIRQGD